MGRAWTLCTRCHRVLWVEDGPTCPECLAAMGEAVPEKPEGEDEESPVFAPVEYRRRGRKATEDIPVEEAEG